MAKKNNCLRIALASMLAVFVVSGNGAAALNLDSRNNKAELQYDFLSHDIMPIMGYIGMPNENGRTEFNGYVNPSFMTKTHFENYKNAGFNMLTGLYEREPFHTSEIMKAIQLAEETELVYFAHDLDFRSAASVSEMAELLKNKWYANKKAFGGIALKDEPSVSDFQSIGNANAALKAVFPGKLNHTTLFPWGASGEQLGVKGNSGVLNENYWARYYDYVSQFIKTTNPQVLPYDSYTLFTEGDDLKNLKNDIVKSVVIDGYFRSLSFFRKLALENNIPFWVSVASYNHVFKKQFTQKHIDWTVNTSLAYGAKGVQYYTYWTQLESGSQAELDNPNKAGMVTLGGTPHDSYYKVQKANKQVMAVDEVLMACQSKGVIQFGTQMLPIPVLDMMYGFNELKTITGGDTFVGCFERNGKSVFYIVNNSINTGNQTFKINFNKKVDIRVLNRDLSKVLTDTYSAGINLSGGEAVLVEVLS